MGLVPTLVFVMEKSKSANDIQMDQIARKLDTIDGLQELGKEATKQAKADKPKPFKK